METLPMDLITEVLFHLPVKSLVRFKLVCKTWENLITSIVFINLHLKHPHTINNNLFAIMENNCSRNVYLICVNTPESIPVKLSLPLLPPPPDKRWSFHHISTCNGLVCFCTSWLPIQIILLNPLTGTHFQIQPPPETYLKTIGFGFGYDHINYDYKVVVLGPGKNNAPIAMIYSLRAKSWRSIDAGEFRTVKQDLEGALLKNHLLHWFSYSKRLSNYAIACLDLCSEKWNMISFPAAMSHPLLHSITDYKGSLCLLPRERSYEPQNDTAPRYIWLFKNESWITLDIHPDMDPFYSSVISNKDNPELSMLAQEGIKFPREQCDECRDHCWHVKF